MKILVLSDSHGKSLPLEKVIQIENPDRVIHLGDGWNDFQNVIAHFPGLEYDQVPGNCDFTVGEPSEKLIEVEGVKIFLTHGHHYGVKEGLLRLTYKAEELGAQVALYGHTHHANYEFHGNVLLFNPGSIGNPPYQNAPSYGILTIKDGIARPELRRWKER